MLCSCDIYTVLCVSRVNTRFRAVAVRKQLWVSILRKLHSRGLMDTPPGEELLQSSTLDLIRDVKRLVLGPETWSPAWTEDPVLRRQTIPRDHDSVRLVCGAKYFVLQDPAGLTFFHATSGKQLWKHTHPNIRAWALDGEATGPTLTLVLTSFFQLRGAVHILRVDLVRGESEVMTRFTPPPFVWLGGLRPGLVENFFALVVQTPAIARTGAAVLFVDWRAEKYVFSNCGHGHPSTLSLVPGHLIICRVDHETLTQQLLLVYTFESFAACWEPINGPNTWDRTPNARNASTIVCERLQFEDIPIHQCRFANLVVHENPLHSNTYDVLLYIEGIPAATPSSMHGTLDQTQQPPTEASLREFSSPQRSTALRRRRYGYQLLAIRPGQKLEPRPRCAPTAAPARSRWWLLGR
ncbi:hypothetical protein B0H17DRAFT_1104992 [Mycena rosella]|uniref:F-box domain-containing protein n=1 Tax=Mycena rosella TaxID=1033263 RepID=A0AAD7C9D6_MYCRO|nr:hypothetical protein B0H17DRAFT_1104992 [Mycena rosella]